MIVRQTLDYAIAPTRRQVLQCLSGGLGLTAAGIGAACMLPSAALAEVNSPRPDRLLQTFNDSVEILPVRFSPDGRTALSGGEDGNVSLWEIATGKKLRSFSGHTEVINSVAYSSDGRTALSGSKDKTLRLCEFLLPLRIVGSGSDQCCYDIVRAA